MNKWSKIRHRHVGADIAPNFKPGTKSAPGEMRMRWVNQENLVRDIRNGWEPVYTETGEISSRPASDNKRAFMLQYIGPEMVQDDTPALKDETYIDSTAEEMNESIAIEHDT